MKKSIRLLCITAALMGAMYWYSGREQEISPLRCVLPTVTDTSDTLRVQGTLTERRRTNLVTTRSALVEQVLYRPGDTVCAGQLLALLKPIHNQEEPAAAFYQMVSGLNLTDLYSSGTAEISYYGKPEDTSIYIFAPTGGIILENHLTEGTTVPAYSPCMVLSDMSEMTISAQVSEETVRYLRESMECTVTVEALEREDLRGTLSCVAPYASRATSALGQTAEVKTGITIRIDQPAGLLPGYTASACFTLARYEDVLLVPYACVGQDEAGEYVMTVRDGYARRTSVTTGQELPDGIRILEGITEDVPVLLDPDLKFDGKPVSLT